MVRTSICGACRVGISSRPLSLFSKQSGPTISRLTLNPSATYPAVRGFRTSNRLYERSTTILNDVVSEVPLRENKLGPAGDASSRNAFSDIAFAFDIDGVLYQGHQPIPGANEMLRKLRAQDMRYVFLTNGGGTHEDAKAASLAKRLNLSEVEDVTQNRVILSHTPMRGWDAATKKQGTVLITGSHPETARKIAIDYGFEKAVTPADIITANDKVYPFAHLKDSLHSASRPLPDGQKIPMLADPMSKDISADTLKIDKILIWNDPRDWSLDIQVIHDLLVSHQGYFGTISSKNGDQSLANNGWQQDGQPDIWVSNLDLLWRTEFPINRFGTGAFVEALKGVWSAVTGGVELQYHALGKPSQLTYEYAHEKLLRLASDTPANGTKPLRRVYMIGDNPESDIRGANEFKPRDGTEWVSILVKTGVWKQTPTEREPRYKPAVIVDDVIDAIVWAMRNEGVNVSREWVLSSAHQ